MSLPTAIIDKLAYGGNGVCRIDGKVCFVPFSCPGDEVSLQVTAQKKSYCLASITDIVSRSHLRTTPECQIFGECGGCSWQHISYSAQLDSKRNILAESLWRGAKVSAELVKATVPSDMQYGYRGRLQFKVSVDSGVLQIGFYRNGSHTVVNAIDGCPVALPVINEVLGNVRSVLQSYSGISAITQLCIDAGDSGVAVVIHHKGNLSSRNRNYFVSRRGELGLCTGLFFKGENNSDLDKVWGVSEVAYLMDSRDPDKKNVKLAYPPGGFAQVNQKQNVSILAIIRLLGGFKRTDKLLDLYCGNGNFSIPLAAEVASVIGVEGNAESVHAAEINKLFNKVDNIQFFCDDAAAGLRRLADQRLKFNKVLLDPPRSGAGDVVSEIVRLSPDEIIYVSCDPSTLARDCGLLSASGYKVVTSVPIDVFPQTYHIESVTLLCRL